jgi:anti-sigma factor RsiW
MMNCHEVETLLPLYIGRDLEEKRANLLTAHMHSCVTCAGSAEEYREAQQLMQLFEPPHFSESVYSGIRSRVLAQIEQESNAPTLLQQLAALFQPRVMWAASAAVLVAVSVLGFYFIAGRTNQQRPVPQLAGSRLDADPARADQQSIAQTRTEEFAKSFLLNAGSSSGSAETVKDANLVSTSQRAGRRRLAGERTRPTRSGEALAMITQASMPDRNPAKSETYPLDASPTPEQPLRVEMQTSDPNIRIVWFSHPLTKANISNDSSKESRR